MFGRRKTSNLSAFRSDPRYYCQVVVISYLPPSQTFRIRKDFNPTGVVPDPIVLLELVLLNSTQLYRWQRGGMLEEIESATATQDWEYIFRQIYKDMKKDVERELLHWRI